MWGGGVCEGVVGEVVWGGEAQGVGWGVLEWGGYWGVGVWGWGGDGGIIGEGGLYLGVWVGWGCLGGLGYVWGFWGGL